MTDQHEPTPPDNDPASNDNVEHAPTIGETTAEGDPDTTDGESDTEEPHDEEDHLDDDDDDLLDDPDAQAGGASPGLHRRTMNEVNAVLLGTLTVCYPERDVQILLDGDAAMRTIAAFRTGRRHQFEDKLDPTTPAAACGWVALDMNPMAMWWLPGLPNAGSTRMTIDPEPVPS